MSYDLCLHFANFRYFIINLLQYVELDSVPSLHLSTVVSVLSKGSFFISSLLRQT